MKFFDKLLEKIRHNELDDSLKIFEDALDEKLKPIQVRKQFVLDLRNSLLRQMPRLEQSRIQPQHKKLRTGLLISGWILGSVLIVTTGVRGFLSIIGVAGLIISWMKQNSQESFSPSNVSQKTVYN
jgi:hypothetical protein